MKRTTAAVGLFAIDPRHGKYNLLGDKAKKYGEISKPNMPLYNKLFVLDQIEQIAKIKHMYIVASPFARFLAGLLLISFICLHVTVCCFPF